MSEERDTILNELAGHFPNMRRHDVEQRLNSVSYALQLPLDKGVSWALDNCSQLHDGWWQAVISDPIRGYLTCRQDSDLTYAICKVWLAWKERTTS